MPLDTTKLALERLLARRARQRAASLGRAKESSERAPRPPTTPHVSLPAALRKYSDGAVRRLLATGKLRGYVTFEEANNILPESEVSSEEIEVLIEAIYELGFELRES
jgi:RNA polymerase primary sigma factor